MRNLYSTITSRVTRIAALALLACSLYACWGKDETFFGIPARVNQGPITGILIGRVNGTGGVGLSNATLRLSPLGLVRTTNASGEFSYGNLAPGPYDLTLDPVTGMICSPLTLAALIVAAQTFQAIFNCAPATGAISGVVTVDNVGQSGITVRLGTRTTQTGAGGAYSFADVAPGSHPVEITPPANSNCNPTSQTVQVTANQTTTANFGCNSNTGSVSGQVLHNDVPVSGATVTMGGKSTTTDSQGRFTLTALAVGTALAVLSNFPPYMMCPNTSATILAAQVIAMTIICSNVPFTIGLAPSYRHFVGSSELCIAIITSALLANVAYLATVSGPGVSGSGQHSGVFDNQGRAFLRNGITLFGTYLWLVRVLGVNQTISMVVNSTPGQCPATNPF